MLRLSGNDDGPKEQEISALFLIEFSNDKHESLIGGANLRSLTIYNSLLPIPFLSTCIHLTELVLSHVNKIYGSDEFPIVHALSSMKCLETIDFLCCQFGSNFLIQLGGIIDSLKQLRMLNLTDMGIYDDAGVSIVRSMCKHPTLTDVCLAKNELMSGGFVAILEVLEKELPHDKPCNINIILNSNGPSAGKLVSFLQERDLRRITCQDAVFLLLCFAKFGGRERLLTKDVLVLIAKAVWKSRYSSAWLSRLAVDEEIKARPLAFVPPLKGIWQVKHATKKAAKK